VLLGINCQGTVAFRADLAHDGDGIFVWPSGKPESIAETSNSCSALGWFPMIEDNSKLNNP
jgi:hypothetical protein